MKRAVEEEVSKRSKMIVIKDVHREAIKKLRLNILESAEALRKGCNGVQRHNPKYFEGLIDCLQDSIVECNSELQLAWFSGFVNVVGSRPREMVTTVEIRQVSVEAEYNYIQFI